MVALGTFVGPDDGEGNSDPWGFIHRLAPGDINYEYADTGIIMVDGGVGKNTYDVQATGTTTYLNTGSGDDAVNVGKANASCSASKLP